MLDLYRSAIADKRILALIVSFGCESQIESQTRKLRIHMVAEPVRSSEEWPAMMLVPKEYEGMIDNKYPWWDGNWLTYEEYKTRVELRADACKKEDLPFLGPRLATNLIGRAFDTLGEISRDELKKENGWNYLLNFLEKTRGRTKVDVLGDTFTEFFLKKDAYRKEGEEIADYENRFKILIRRMERAVKEANSEAKIPSELFGWYLLNVFMRMSPSDTANIRGKAASYKLEDVLDALRQMWSSGGLGVRDAEIKGKRKGLAFAAQEDDDGDQEDREYEAEDEIYEAEEWFEEAAMALAEDGENEAILANFRDARKALDQARTARGFFPVRHPSKGTSRGKGKGKFRTSQRKGSQNDDCFRCGKPGHRARNCPQIADRSRTGSIGFVGWFDGASCEKSALVGGDEPCEKGDEPLDDTKDDEPGMILMTKCWQKAEIGPIYVNQEKEHRGKAILDSGASDNIVGAETLQDLADVLTELDFEAKDEIQVNRQVHKRFVFGNNATSAGLGLAHVNAGLCGKEVEVQAHLVEGPTPFLLSSKFLYDMEATINFRTGKAIFRTLGEQQIQLERSANHHLMLPLTAYQGNATVMHSLLVAQGDEDLSVLSLSQEDTPKLESTASPEDSSMEEVDKAGGTQDA